VGVLLVYAYESRGPRNEQVVEGDEPPPKVKPAGPGKPALTGTDRATPSGPEQVATPEPPTAPAKDPDIAAVAGPDRPPPAPIKAVAAPKPKQAPVEEQRTRTETVEVTRRLKIAVSKYQFDDIGQLLNTMGEGYKEFTELDWVAIQDPERLKQYDILFLTCSAPKNLPDSAAGTLRNFVQSGKTLYVSDLWYTLLAKAFPEAGAVVGKDNIYGDKQDIFADVRDTSLQSTFGKRLELSFDAKGWAPAKFAGPQVKALVSGQFSDVAGAFREESLLVKFPSGQGTVIFTSFHNSKLVGDSALKLLKALVVIVATARVERETLETAIKGGLSPRHDSLLTASHGGEPVKRTYQNRRRGRLKFILGFDKRAGASLKLTVTGPDGRPIEKVGTEGVEIEIPEADPGQWSYTISVIKVPYDNFGYQLLIAE
jgi:hypothetical protein